MRYDELAQALKIAAPGWSDEAAGHIAAEIFKGFLDHYDEKVAKEGLENLVGDVEIANSETPDSFDWDAEAKAEVYRAEEEPASRRPGAARLSSTLRSEIGYEDARR